MRTKILAAIVLLIASTLALNTSGLPSCGQTCFEKANSAQSTCSSTDLSCLCRDTGLWEAFGYCLGSTCDSADIETSLEWIRTTCDGSTTGGLATTTSPIVLYPTTSADATSASAAAVSPTTVASESTIAAATQTSFASTTEAAIGTATETAGSNSNPLPSSPSTNTDSSQGGSGGLSTAAKVGIGVGVPLGVLLIAGGILLAYCLGRRKRRTPTANASNIEQQPPTSFAAVPVTTEKMPHESTVKEFYPPRPGRVQQPASSQATEDPVVEPPTEPIYPPQQPGAAFPPPAYARSQPNAYEVPGNTTHQQSTIAHSQFSQVYEVSDGQSQHIYASHSPPGPPSPINVDDEASKNGPGAPGAIEHPSP